MEYHVDGIEHCDCRDLIKVVEGVDALDPCDVGIAAKTADDGGSIAVPQESEDGVLLHEIREMCAKREPYQMHFRGDSDVTQDGHIATATIPPTPALQRCCLHSMLG